MRRKITSKIKGLAFVIMLIFLIFTILIPPATSVHIYPGTISDSTVTKGSTVTFSDINLTIRGEEKIPISELNFSIHNNNNDNVIAYVTFSVDGTEIGEHPSGKFTVTNTTISKSNWYSYGYGYGYDEPYGSANYFGYGYGYGYGDSEYSDITFLYDIVYTTHKTGTFYWNFSVNASNDETSHLFTNSSSGTFKVSSDDDGGGGGGAPAPSTELTADANGPYNGIVNKTIVFDGSGSSDDGTITDYTWDFGDGINGSGIAPSHRYSSTGLFNVTLTITDDDDNTDIDSTTVTITEYIYDVSDETKQTVETIQNITLTEKFFATDTDDDGILDTFTDPNGILDSVRFFDENESQFILISVNGDSDCLFIWDTEDNSIITSVNHSIGSVESVEINETANTIELMVSVEKANWTYFEIEDDYPELTTLVIQTTDGRIIPGDHIWRENETIYVVDDPELIYHLIYTRFLFDISVELSKNSIKPNEELEAMVQVMNVGIPGQANASLTINLNQGSANVWSTTKNLSVSTQLAYNQTIPTKDLPSASYTINVIYSYGVNQTAEATASFTITEPSGGVPWILILGFYVILGAIAIFYYLYKRGIIIIER